MQEINRYEFDSLKKDVSTALNKIDKVLTAILGSELTEEGGMVRQMTLMSLQIEDLKEENAKIKTQLTQYKGISIGLMIASGVIGYLGSLLISILSKH